VSKSARLLIRIEPEQLAQFQEAAKVAGKSVSDWLRDAGTAAIIGVRPTVATSEPEPSTQSRAVALVASIPGVRLGIPMAGGLCIASGVGQEERSQTLAVPNSANEDGDTHSDTPEAIEELGEDVPTKPWLPELMRIQRMGEIDPESAADELRRLVPEFKPPKGWAGWSIGQRAAWLDLNRPLEIE
jgi:hypothetical protein